MFEEIKGEDDRFKKEQVVRIWLQIFVNGAK